ncbi:zinc ribbon domain-containing protein [Streptomyces sp. NPDC048507]|uniref:zinc ribbon domain-containing protein n=1 Tax=Streptomyces sp. NPDC048507 TaxID=3365560 RepID=UPI0037191603
MPFLPGRRAGASTAGAGTAGEEQQEPGRRPHQSGEAPRGCAACGAVADELPLTVREWTCSGCGTVHDRDGNAANHLRGSGRKT